MQSYFERFSCQGYTAYDTMKGNRADPILNPFA